jgi:hypothetical protein
MLKPISATTFGSKLRDLFVPSCLNNQFETQVRFSKLCKLQDNLL